MTYDDWKLRSDRDDSPGPESRSFCSECGHPDECDCSCCSEPPEKILTDLLVAAREAVKDFEDRDCCGKVGGKHWNKCGILLLEQAIAKAESK